MPNARIQSTVANGRVGYNAVNVRVSNFQTGVLTPASSIAGAPIGSPIGLLLALTYAADMSSSTPVVYRGDSRPNVRITTY